MYLKLKSCNITFKWLLLHIIMYKCTSNKTGSWTWGKKCLKSCHFNVRNFHANLIDNCQYEMDNDQLLWGNKFLMLKFKIEQFFFFIKMILYTAYKTEIFVKSKLNMPLHFRGKTE